MTTWRVRVQDSEGRQRGVRIDGSADASPTELAAAVQRLGVRGRPVLLRGHPITEWSTIAGTGLRHGDLLCCGEPYAGVPLPEQPPLTPGRHLVVITGPDAGLVVPLSVGTWSLGRSRAADVTISDPELSAVHAEIELDGESITLQDRGSTNGTSVEGRQLSEREPTPVAVGHYVEVGATILTIADFDQADLAVLDNHAPPEAILQRHFRPALDQLPSRLTPPREPHRGELIGPSWWRSLTPLVTGVGFAVLTGRWEFLLITALAPVLFFFDARRARREQGERLLLEKAAHQAALDEFCSTVDELRETERHRRRDRAAIGGVAVARALLPHRRLWERQPADPDFLSVDIGLACQPVEVLADDDDLATGPPKHRNVPVDASLPELGSIAVVGHSNQTRAALRALVLGLVSTHAPDDMRLWFFCSPDAASEWDFVRWLPHATDDHGNARLANDPTEVAERFSQLARRMSTEREGPGRSTGESKSPVDVVIVDQDTALPTEARADLLRLGPTGGVHSLVADRSAAPDGTGGRLDLSPGGQATFRSVRQPFLSNVHVAQTSVDVARTAALALAPIRTAHCGHVSRNESPRLLDLLDMAELDPRAILRAWQSSGPTTEAIVGLTSEAPLTIDIAKHGPHGLIGGMSGSGKTELLMTLLSSLCIKNHPDDLAVAIVDFKGGVDHGLTARLPHVVGMSTNLDAAQFSRTIELLDAEQRRRQALFNGVGADLNAYRSARDARPELPPVPRLIVIVDEFSELLASDEGKEHLNELIRVTRIGRALGVHLVLVTQNFEGQLPTQVEANAGLRICLRVTKASHSKVVLGTGAAAELDEHSVGRAIARLNGRALVEFQTARVAGRRTDLAPAKPSTNAGQGTRLEIDWLSSRPRPAHPTAGSEPNCPIVETDLHAIVETLNEAARASGWTRSAVPWPAELPAVVSLTDLLEREGPPTPAPPPATTTEIPFGLEDRPDEQRHRTATIGADDGDILLVGGDGSGLTQAVETLAISAASMHSPERLHLHHIDLDGSGLDLLGGLPHAGTTSVRDDRLALRLLCHLDGLVADRRLTRQIEGAPPTPGAHQLVFVTGADRLVRRGDDRHPLLDPLLQVMLDAPGLGVQFVLAGLPSLIDSRLVANIDRRYVFRCSGDTRPGGLGVPRSLTARLDRPGRAVDTQRHRLLQMAAASATDRAQAASRWLGPAARQPDPAPEPSENRPKRLRSVGWPLAAASICLGSPPSRNRLPFPLAVESDSGEVLWVDGAEDGPMIVVTGPAKSGRTTALVSAGFFAKRAGWTCLAVAGSRRSALAAGSSAKHAPWEHAAFSHVVGSGGLDDALIAHRERRNTPLAVTLDDAHRLSSDAFDTELLVATADVIVMAGPLDFVSGRTQLRRALPHHDVGLLLNPIGALDGHAVGLSGRLPAEARTGRRPGVGLAVVAGEATAITVPLHRGQAARA